MRCWSCRHLIRALEWKAAPTEQQIADARKPLDRWGKNLEKFKQRLASLTIEPPTKPQLRRTAGLVDGLRFAQAVTAQRESCEVS